MGRKFIWFENSDHLISYEEPEKYSDILINNMPANESWDSFCRYRLFPMSQYSPGNISGRHSSPIILVHCFTFPSSRECNFRPSDRSNIPLREPRFRFPFCTFRPHPRRWLQHEKVKNVHLCGIRALLVHFQKKRLFEIKLSRTRLASLLATIAGLLPAKKCWSGI